MTKTRHYAMILCLMAAVGCADRMNSGANSSSSGYGSGSGATGSGTAGSSTAGATTGSSGSAMTGAGNTAAAQQQTMYGVVQAIDQMQRQDVGAGVIGAAAAGGSTGMPTDKVYRITVRMDDGSSQMVVVESQPGYRIGDRVRYNNGMVEAY